MSSQVPALGKGSRAGPAVLAAAVLAFTLAPAAPARAFELFGIHLWGEKSSASEAVVDPVRYKARLTVVSGNRDVERDLEGQSLLRARTGEPPSGTVGRLQRAREDQANKVGQLYEEGYCGALVNIRIAGRAIESIAGTDNVGEA